MSYGIGGSQKNNDVGKIGTVDRIDPDGIIISLESGNKGIVPLEYMEPNNLDVSDFRVGERFTVFPVVKKKKGGRREIQLLNDLPVLGLRYKSSNGKVYVSSKLDRIRYGVTIEFDILTEEEKREYLFELLEEMIWRNTDALFQLDDYCLNRRSKPDEQVKSFLIAKHVLAENGDLPDRTNEIMYEMRTGQRPFWLKEKDNADKIIDFAEGLKESSMHHNKQSPELALRCCITGMITCLDRLSKQEDDVYFNSFIELFTESMKMVDTEHGSDEMIGHCLSAVNMLEIYEAKCPDNMSLKVLIMTVLDKAAERCIQTNMYDATVVMYEYQRDKLISFSDMIDDIRLRLALIDKKMLMPCILSGNRAKARTVGEEAYEVLGAFSRNEPHKYAVDFIEVCCNLGGIYMDENELDAAGTVFLQGIAVWNSLPQSIKRSFEAFDGILVKKTLDNNIEKLTRKKSGLS